MTPRPISHGVYDSLTECLGHSWACNDFLIKCYRYGAGYKNIRYAQLQSEVTFNLTSITAGILGITGITLPSVPYRLTAGRSQ